MKLFMNVIAIVGSLIIPSEQLTEAGLVIGGTLPMVVWLKLWK